MDREAEQFLIPAKRSACLDAGGVSGSQQDAAGRFRYTGTHFGTEQFAGQEILLEEERPIWTVNFLGRTAGQEFPAEFLREALLAGCQHFPYRGAERYEKGEWVYTCAVRGEPDWFYGYEEIRHQGHRVYECAFHGGEIR